MKRMVGLIIAALIIVLGVTAYLNRGDMAFKKESQDDGVFVIKSGGQEVARVDMQFVKSLDKVDFEANLKRSGKDPEKHTFTGVPMKTIFEKLNVDVQGKSTVVVKAVDGYASAISLDEALEENNVYIAYAIDNKPLGKKEDGGSGPFEMVISKDPFSQRWCKFVSEVEFQ